LFTRVHAEENKRRTLQRSDIATAISKTDMCDFLIDIVPREEATKPANPVYDQATYNNNNVAAAAAAAYYQPQYAPNQIDPNYYSQIPQVISSTLLSVNDICIYSLFYLVYKRSSSTISNVATIYSTTSQL
jgi:hypothetical protein